MDGFYSFVIRIGALVLLTIAAVNFLGALGMVFGGPMTMPGGPVLGLAAAFNSMLWPFVAASALLRFDRWFAIWAGSQAQ